MTDRIRAVLVSVGALVIGAALLAVVLMNTDLSQVRAYLSQVGIGIVLMIAVYSLAFVLDSWAWLMTLRSLPLRVVWIFRFWMVRMVGEAVNNATPLAGMGGEPVKAAILNRAYGIGYGDGFASIVLARTTFVIGLVPFLLIGFALLLFEPGLSEGFKWAAGVGLVGLLRGSRRSLPFNACGLRPARAAGLRGFYHGLVFGIFSRRSVNSRTGWLIFIAIHPDDL
jgi:hypothetical protein